MTLYTYIHVYARIKHVIDTQGGSLLGVVLNIVLINTKDLPVIANTSDVLTGSTVNGIYLKVEVSASSAGALANAYMMVYKNPGNDLTFPNPNIVGTSDKKKFVIHQEMVMLEQTTGGNPRTLFNGVIAIPRGYRRNGPNDRLELDVFSPGVDMNVCVQCHYKEFR